MSENISKTNCPKCGSDILAEMPACPSCGEKLIVEHPASLPRDASAVKEPQFDDDPYEGRA